MDAETGFTIQGKIYPEPDLFSLNNDENQILYESTGSSQEDFFRLGDETKDEWAERIAKIFGHPGFDFAWMRIAFQRGNPHLSAAKVKQIVGQTNTYEAKATLRADQVEEREDEEVPLASTSEPNKPSSTSSLENENSTKQNSETPGTDSTTSSDSPASTPLAIGGLRSVTSAISAPENSAA